MKWSACLITTTVLQSETHVHVLFNVYEFNTDFRVVRSARRCAVNFRDMNNVASIWARQVCRSGRGKLNLKAVHEAVPC